MKEIKFRVWTGNKMVYVGAKHNDTIFLSITGGGWSLYDQFMGVSIEMCSIDDAKAGLMQFTGITDIEGREIYEGDIVSVKLTNLEWSAAVEVSRSDEHAGFCLDWYSGTMLVHLDYKVIGNIYENPELLKKEQS